MRNIIDANIYKVLRSKGYYGICGFLGIYILIQLYTVIRHGIKPALTGVDTIISFLSGDHMIVILLLIIIGKQMLKDYESGVIKNILARGVTRSQYFIGQIISSYIIIGVTWVAFVFVLVCINSIQSGIGEVNIKFIVIGGILNMIFILTLIVMMIATIAITRNGIIVVLIFIGAVNIAEIAMIIFSLFNMTLNLSKFEMTTYIGALSLKSNNNELLFLKGMGVMAVYLTVSMIVGLYVMKKQDVK
ncbi:hypothetical protein [uncultured Clostridium sp.]|uniref:hypothetical protein n=1 Tax=uncultured Clostridium sp. TaxID=59620 RepID=UPI002611C786|nr:hypothetical protein [uncultured Clostridium sp.]